MKILRDADRTEYLEYCERQTKTRSGEEPRNIRPVKAKTFARPDGPLEKTQFLSTNSTLRKDLAQCRALKHLYYFGINNSKDSSKCWFKESLMGVNKLIPR